MSSMTGDAHPPERFETVYHHRRRDFYADLYSLKADLKQGIDYVIYCRPGKSGVTVVAPHGGNIESGTSELARAIAGNEHNLFDFVFMNGSFRSRGHVTSTNFMDERLASLLSRSRICVSLHRMRDRHHRIYLGGRNRELKELASERLCAMGFITELEPPRLKGVDKRNFVNLASERGLQVEIPVPVAEALLPGVSEYARSASVYRLRRKTSPSFQAFVFAIRSAVDDYMDSNMEQR
ncbi:MAG: poly-gamma-glutamate hydrolase family protein [Candidatus Melainabacteria bacterium]|nr:poly-gamma-glutamate hydrolase family protein [Candidatus Melainabacteria bacterium]